MDEYVVTLWGGDEPEAVGLWCAACAVPSAVRFRVLITDPGLRLCGDVAMTVCVECGERR